MLDGQQNKPSTNGTWKYISKEMVLRDKMILRAELPY